MQAMITLRGLSKTYGLRRVLRGVTLDVAPGERLAIIGANGAGKTTLLRTVAGLARPTEGSVIVGGWDAQRDGLRARALIGLLSHSPLAYPGLTAAENLRFGATLYGLRDPARIDALLARVGLEYYAQAPVATYSRGMRQRLAIARLFLHEPPVLLLDEPFAGLDPEGVAVLRALIDEGGHPRTLLMTAHVLETLHGWVDRAALLERGTLEAQP